MKSDDKSSALERLIAPLPNDIKSAVLEAWKNEDIPHDENDTLYRLMILLTLYARFYQEMVINLSAELTKIKQTQAEHQDQMRSLCTTQSEQSRELGNKLTTVEERVSIHWKSEIQALTSNLRSEGKSILQDFSQFSSHFKCDSQQWKERAYFMFLLAGVLLGMGFTLLLLAILLMRS